MSSPLPRCLTRHGVHQVRDNIPDGHEIGGWETEFLELFGRTVFTELAKRFGEEVGASSQTPPVETAPSAGNRAGAALRVNED